MTGKFSSWILSRNSRTPGLLLLLLVIAGCSQQADWPLYGREYNNQRFSPLKQIDTSNVAHLKLAWRYHTGRHATFQASPIVINGVMYLTTPFNDVIALDATTGKEIWHYTHPLREKRFCCGPANRGATVAGERVYTVTIDARLIALLEATAMDQRLEART